MDSVLRSLASLDALGSPRNSFMFDSRADAPGSMMMTASCRRSSTPGIPLSPIPRLSLTGLAGSPFLAGPAAAAAAASSASIGAPLSSTVPMLSMAGPGGDSRRRSSTASTEYTGLRPAGLQHGGLLPSAGHGREPLSPVSPGLLMRAGLFRLPSGAARMSDGGGGSAGARRRSSDYGLDFRASSMAFPRRSSGSFFDLAGAAFSVGGRRTSSSIPSRGSRMSLVEVSEMLADATGNTSAAATSSSAAAIPSSPQPDSPAVSRSLSTAMPLEDEIFGTVLRQSVPATRIFEAPPMGMEAIVEEDVKPAVAVIAPVPPSRRRRANRALSASGGNGAGLLPMAPVCQSVSAPSCGTSRHGGSAGGSGDRKRKPKPYQSCQHCEKLFLCASKLERHLRTHTGAKPYSCQCGQAFSQKSSLKVHSRRHALDAVKNGVEVENGLINGFPIAGLLADAKRAKEHGATRSSKTPRSAGHRRPRSAGAVSTSPGTPPSLSSVTLSPKLNRASLSKAVKSRRSPGTPSPSPSSPWLAVAGQPSPVAIEDRNSSSSRDARNSSLAVPGARMTGSPTRKSSLDMVFAPLTGAIDFESW